MATNNLTFSKSGSNGGYTARFVSDGPVILQLERTEQGIVSVKANLPGLPPVPVQTLRTIYGANMVFAVDLPAGVEVTVVSATEVSNAKMIRQDV